MAAAADHLQEKICQSPDYNNGYGDEQEEESGGRRGKLGGRVCIPEKWGQEGLLKDWMDYSMFDALLAPKGLASARQALVADTQRRQPPETTTTRRQLVEVERLS